MGGTERDRAREAETARAGGGREGGRAPLRKAGGETERFGWSEKEEKSGEVLSNLLGRSCRGANRASRRARSRDCVWGKMSEFTNTNVPKMT